MGLAAGSEARAVSRERRGPFHDHADACAACADPLALCPRGAALAHEHSDRDVAEAVERFREKRCQETARRRAAGFR